MVRVPAGVLPGQNFAASINGRRFVVQCPPGITAGMPLHIRVPDEGGAGGPPSNVGGGVGPNMVPPSGGGNGSGSGSSGGGQQTFMVTVPTGIRPGQQFAVMANGQRVTVTCPASCSGGSQVYVRVPSRQNGPGHGKNAEDEDDYEVLEAALAEINDKQGRRKSAFERKVGDDGKLHWVKAVSVDEGKMGDLKVAEAEVENEGVVVEGKTGKRILFRQRKSMAQVGWCGWCSVVLCPLPRRRMCLFSRCLNVMPCLSFCSTLTSLTTTTSSWPFFPLLPDRQQIQWNGLGTIPVGQQWQFNICTGPRSRD